MATTKKGGRAARRPGPVEPAVPARRPGRPPLAVAVKRQGVQIIVWLMPAELAALDRIVAARGTNRAQVMRELVLAEDARVGRAARAR